MKFTPTLESLDLRFTPAPVGPTPEDPTGNPVSTAPSVVPEPILAPDQLAIPTQGTNFVVLPIFVGLPPIPVPLTPAPSGVPDDLEIGPAVWP